MALCHGDKRLAWQGGKEVWRRPSRGAGAPQGLGFRVTVASEPRMAGNLAEGRGGQARAPLGLPSLLPKSLNLHFAPAPPLHELLATPTHLERAPPTAGLSPGMVG